MSYFCAPKHRQFKYSLNLVESNDYFFEIKPKDRVGLNVKELVEYRELFYFFTWRDVKVKYKQTVLGFLWAVIQPLLLMIIFTFFFAKPMKVPSDNVEYPVFTFSGLILWTIFSSGITNAGNSMVSNAQIIKKIYFPRLIIPISTILASVIDFAITFVMFLALIVFFHQPVNLTYAIVFWPMGLMIAVIATFGPGCWLAALNIKYRDFRYVIPFLVQSLLFLTPVIYPISIVSDSWVKYLMAINPMYAAITIFRLPLSQSMPELLLVTISLLSGLVLFVGGLYYFRRTEMYFADLA